MTAPKGARDAGLSRGADGTRASMPRLDCPGAMAGHSRAASVGLGGRMSALNSWRPAREFDTGVVGARQLHSRQAQRWVRRLAATVSGSWLVSRLMPTLDRATLRVTGQRRTLTAIIAVYPLCSSRQLGPRRGCRTPSPYSGSPQAKAWSWRRATSATGQNPRGAQI